MFGSQRPERWRTITDFVLSDMAVIGAVLRRLVKRAPDGPGDKSRPAPARQKERDCFRRQREKAGRSRGHRALDGAVARFIPTAISESALANSFVNSGARATLWIGLSR